MHTSAVSRLARCSSASRTVSVSRRTGGRSDRTASRTTRPSSDGSAIARSATPASTWSTRTAPVTATNRSAATSATVDDGEASCMATTLVNARSWSGPSPRAAISAATPAPGSRTQPAAGRCRQPWQKETAAWMAVRGSGDSISARPNVVTSRARRTSSRWAAGRERSKAWRRRRHPHRRTSAVVGRATRPSHLRSAQGAATVIGARCEAVSVGTSIARGPCAFSRCHARDPPPRLSARAQP